MRTLRKYTGFLAKIHDFALIFSFLFPYATPQVSKAFAQSPDDGIKVLRAPLKAEAIEGEYIVMFKPSKHLKKLTKNTKPAWLEKLGNNVKIDTSLSKYNIAHLKVANPTSTGQWENLAKILSSDPTIEFVEPNYIRYGLGTIPNDQYLSELWHLNNVEAFKAWNTISPSSNNEDDIIVAVADTGIQINHEDLKGHLWHNPKEIAGNYKDDDGNGYIDDTVGWNFVDQNEMPYSYLNPAPTIVKNLKTGKYECHNHPTKKSYETHGTHVAGIIAGVRNNQVGIAGISNKIKIMPIRVLTGGCPRGDTMAILKGVIYAADNGAKIINMSLGGYGATILEQRVYEDLSKKGILIVAAAGNDANNNDIGMPHTPSDYPIPGIISVAASNERDQLADFSNYGKKNVDLAAPGEEILSTIPFDGGDEFPESFYKKASGTSMAAPVVSGAAALLLAQNPKLTNIQLKQILLENVDPIAAFKDKTVSGGRLNIYKALSNRTSINQHNPTTNSVGGIRIFDKRSSNQQKW